MEYFVLIPEVLLLLRFSTFFRFYFLVATWVSATSLPLSFTILVCDVSSIVLLLRGHW